MEYGRLIRQSFELAWRYKTLWIFGLFAGGGGSFNLNLPFGGDDFQNDSGLRDLGFDVDSWDIPQDFESLMPLLGGVILALLILFLIYLIMHFISVPTIIDAVNKITRGGVYEMGTSFSRGLDFFWRFLGLGLLTFGAWIMTIGVAAILFITIIGIIIAVPLFFFGLYFWFTLFELAKRVMVARDCSIGDSLSEAYLIIKTRFGDTIIMALIVFGLSLATGLAVFLIWAFVGIPLGTIVWAVTESAALGLILGVLIGFPISIVLGGYLGTFFTSLYTMFYFELLEPSPATAEVSPTAPPRPEVGGYSPPTPPPPPGHDTPGGTPAGGPETTPPASPPETKPPDDKPDPQSPPPGGPVG